MNFKINETEQKLRGGYYTPLELAQYLSKWVSEIDPKKVIEPSCGDGVFIEALASHLSHGSNITGVELNSVEASKSAKRVHKFKNVSADIKNADFLEWYLFNQDQCGTFDASVGNPPFIRYQYLSKRDQSYSEKIFKIHDLPFTKHTNAWVPFIIASLDLLRPGGRIAMVVPAEILHILHAQSLRTYIGKHCKRIILLDPEEIWFEGTLQGAVLFLAQKKNNPRERSDGLKIIPIAGKSFLNETPSFYFEKSIFINGKTISGKWTRALLTKKEIDLFDGVCQSPDVKIFKDVAKVDVGIVTGANKFFLVPSETVNNFDLKKWAYPMFGRSSHCPGIIYDEAQHNNNNFNELPSNFIWFAENGPNDLNKGALRYIEMGEKEELHKRYKCRIRTPWYKVPSVYSTPVGMLKRSHDVPRLIYNKIGAFTTDTAYRITPKGIDEKKLVYCFFNSFTALAAELEGRHYGGGVLELVPSEIERLHIPLPKNTRPSLRNLDSAVRNEKPCDVLRKQDEIVLKNLNLSKDEIIMLNDAWSKLKRRRQRSS